MTGQMAHRIDSRNHQDTPAVAHELARLLHRRDETANAQVERPRQVVRLDREQRFEGGRRRIDDKKIDAPELGAGVLD